PHSPMKLPFPALLLALASTAVAHDANIEMAKAANAFLASLTPEQKSQATFPFESEANGERVNWHFIPRERKGLPIKAMTEPQRALARALLKTGLSDDGFKKAEIIQSLEAILRVMEKDTTGKRDPEKYYVSVFGTPGGKDPWAWRWEGHHQSFNYTSVADAAPSMTPSFFGSNPGEVREGDRKGLRVLGTEEDLGRALVKSLDEEQRKTAVILAEAPKEIFNDPKRPDSTKPEGLAYSKMTAGQQAALVKIIKEYLFRCRPDVAAEEFAKIEKSGLGNVYFAWAGGFELGQPHYYRVQNAAFVLEYDNTQNNANHVHSIWREFGGDFGADLLKQHVRERHAK
ncbi:MAG: DUF3500 domain-containing protein, partial [Chthoniobacteraceae bacterium]